jgi:hypothetical protein
MIQCKKMIDNIIKIFKLIFMNIKKMFLLSVIFLKQTNIIALYYRQSASISSHLNKTDYLRNQNFIIIQVQGILFILNKPII